MEGAPKFAESQTLPDVDYAALRRQPRAAGDHRRQARPDRPGLGAGAGRRPADRAGRAHRPGRAADPAARDLRADEGRGAGACSRATTNRWGVIKEGVKTKVQEILPHHEDYERRWPTPLIEAITVGAYTVPTDAPEADGTLAWDATTLVLVQVARRRPGRHRLDLRPGRLRRRWSTDLLADGRAGPGRVGRRRALARRWSAPSATPAARASVGYAISAVDVALWDLKARLLDLPAAPAARRRPRRRCRSTAAAASPPTTTAQLRDQLTGWTQNRASRGSRSRSGSPGARDRARDLARIAQARDVDRRRTSSCTSTPTAPTSASRPSASIRAAAEQDVTWFEEPVSSDDLDGLREVRDAVTPDVAAGEYGYDLAYFRRMCAAGAVDCLQADVSRCGGITEWLRVAAVAAAHGLDISGHCAPAPARPRRRGRPQPAAPGMVPRPRPDRSRCSSTAPSTPPTEPSDPTRPPPATVWSSARTTSRSTGSCDRPAGWGR